MERGVSTYPVIKGFDVIKGIAPGLRSRLKGLAINAFAFEAMKEALHRCIIVTISSTTHADDHLFLLQECLIALTRVRACAERRKGADRKKKEEKRAKEERGEEEHHVHMLSRAACLSLRCNRCRMGDPGAVDPRSQERRDDPRKLSGERSSMAFCMCSAVGVPGGCCPMICLTGVPSTCIFASGNGLASGNRSTPRGVRQVRVCLGRDPEPSAAILDSQSIKTSAVRGDERGYDGGKKNSRPQTASARGHARAAAGRQSAGG